MKEFNKLIFLAYVIVTFTPIITNNYLQIGLVLLWVLTAFVIERRIVLDWKISILIWIFYALFLKVINFSSATWGNYGIYVLFFFPLWVFDFYRRNLDRKSIEILSKLIIVILSLNMVQNVYMLVLHPGATIELNFSDIYNGLNLGNSNFTFAVMLMLLLCFWKAINKKWCYIAISVVGVAYLVLSSKTTAFLVFVIFSFLFLANELTKNLRSVQRIVVMVLIVLLTPILFYEVLPLLQSIIDSDYLNARISALISGRADSLYLSRIWLAGISLSSFFSHPIFGIGYVKADFSQVLYYTTGIGHHSEFIDHLGRYGIVGAAFYIYIFSKFWHYLKSTSENVESRTIKVFTFVAFLLFSFLNNSMDSLSGIILFFLVPSIEIEYFIPRVYVNTETVAMRWQKYGRSEVKKQN